MNRPRLMATTGMMRTFILKHLKTGLTFQGTEILPDNCVLFHVVGKQGYPFDVRCQYSPSHRGDISSLLLSSIDQIDLLGGFETSPIWVIKGSVTVDDLEFTQVHKQLLDTLMECLNRYWPKFLAGEEI